MFQKTKNFVKEKAKRLEKVFTPMIVAGAATGIVPTVYAIPDETKNTLNTTMSSILSMVTTIFFYIGILLAVWGIGSLVMAFKNEDADSKTRAIMSITVGVVLMFLKAFINPILTAADAGFQI